MPESWLCRDMILDRMRFLTVHINAMTRTTLKAINNSSELEKILFPNCMTVLLIFSFNPSATSPKASNTGTPVVLDEISDAGIAYQDAIARFLGEDRPMKFVNAERKGIFRRLFSKNREEVAV